MARRPVLNALTGIRFIAALYVVLFHYLDPARLDLALPAHFAVYHLVRYGYVGVSVFFVLSGFVLAYNYPTFEDPAGRRCFWRARFARIYPLYLTALLLSLPVFASYADFGSLFDVLKEGTKVGIEAALLNAWTPWTSCGVNCPGWSLSAEAFFYLVFPFIIPLFHSMGSRRLLAVAAGLWGLGVILPFLYMLSGGSPAAVTRGEVLFRDVIRFTPLLHLPQFLIGAVTGLLYTRRQAGGAPFWKPARGLAALALGVIIWAMLSFEIEYALVNNGLFAPLFAFIFFVLARDSSFLTQLFSRPWMVALGEASYAVYILQYPLAGWFARLREGTWQAVKLDTGPLLVYSMLLVALSLASYKFLETPTRRWIISRFGGKTPSIARKV